VKLHTVHGNLMVDVKPTNAKLYRRATALVVRATGADDLAAERTLRACDWRVKVAIVAIASKVDVGQAIARLEAAEGSVRRALGRG
jgi:N-acetylmuramic acid 6-phosphate etherase